MEKLNFWKGKNVLITGHTGFKGSWLSVFLQYLDCNVYGYSLKPQGNVSLFNELGIESKIHSFIGDIRDKELLQKKIEEFNPEIIFHMAAQPLVLESYKNPIGTLETNIIGVANILEACRNIDSLRAIINITTDKCYLNEELGNLFKENDPLGGKDIYSASKASSEIITKAYRDSFYKLKRCKIATARAGNVIGGGDWSDNRLIPDIVNAINSNTNIEIRSPQSIRPWQHVLDPLFGYMHLAEKVYTQNSYDEAWNFGPNDEGFITVNEIALKVLNYMGSDIKLDFINNSEEFFESKILKLDINKSKNKLGWMPVWQIEKTIEKTALWYKNFYSNKICAYDLCIKNIQEFISDL
jgi:CDP-glucose 4,6-dehydratase